MEQSGTQVARIVVAQPQQFVRDRLEPAQRGACLGGEGEDRDPGVGGSVGVVAPRDLQRAGVLLAQGGQQVSRGRDEGVPLMVGWIGEDRRGAASLAGWCVC